MDFHLGLKFSCLDRNALFLQFLDQLFVEFFGLSRFCSVYKRRPSSLPAISIKGELGDNQHLPSNLPEGQVELPRGILEDSKVRELRGHKGDIFLSIPFPPSQQDEKDIAFMASK